MDSTLAPTVLDRARAADVRTDPFPHLVIEDALPAPLCRELAASFPDFRRVGWDGEPPSNQRFALFAFLALLRDFLRRVRALFAGHWTEACEHIWAGLDEARLGYVMRDGEDADILVDARLELNTPVKDGPSVVRGAHLDTPNRLFSALYYLRRDGDDTPGGDLGLYRFTGAPPAQGLDRFAFDPEEVEEVARVPYRANTLVIFPNRPTALHGVTARPVTPWQRNYVFITAEVASDLF